MKYGLFLEGFLQQFNKFILKKVYQFFSENVTKIYYDKMPILKAETHIYFKMTLFNDHFLMKK